MFVSFAERVERLSVAVWTGGMIAIGYVAAPVLFSALDDRRLAGALAGQMFSVVATAGAIIGLLLLAMQIVRLRGGFLRQWRNWVLSVMWLLALASLFVVQPMMADLKAQGLMPGSEAARQFGMMHGVSSVLYLLSVLGGLLLIWAGMRPGEASRARSAIGGQI